MAPTPPHTNDVTSRRMPAMISEPTLSQYSQSTKVLFRAA